MCFWKSTRSWSWARPWAGLGDACAPWSLSAWSCELPVQMLNKLALCEGYKHGSSIPVEKAATGLGVSGLRGSNWPVTLWATVLEQPERTLPDTQGNSPRTLQTCLST